MFESISARFPSDYSLSESVSRLQALLQPWDPREKTLQSHAVGRVDEDGVRLCRVKPYLRNDFKFKPHFSGRFVEVDGQIVLEGRFGLSASTKAFMSVWFGFGVLWTLVAFFIFTHNPGKDWIFPLLGLGMLLGGAGMIKLGSWWSRNDVGWLAELIRDALTAQ